MTAEGIFILFIRIGRMFVLTLLTKVIILLYNNSRVLFAVERRNAMGKNIAKKVFGIIASFILVVCIGAVAGLSTKIFNAKTDDSSIDKVSV